MNAPDADGRSLHKRMEAQMNEQDRRRQREQEERAEAERNRAQRALDRAWQRMRDLDAEDRRIRRELDPFGWGHWK